ncbi:MAG: hypothetical protein JWL77_3246 [Chthonomonadaceae bacterium]|nr:hypothetical protein [Chthonomonadaceae bacterium]
MTLHDLAEQNVRQARILYENDRREEAIALQRRAALQYALAMRDVETPAPDVWHVRADACRMLGEYLAEAEAYPEAATYYQEAIDCYAHLDTEEAEIAARECAVRALAVVRALQSRPEQRLYLLTARYERQRQQFALETNTEAQQAERCVHIARIFQRRDRPDEAITHYREALALYALTPQEETGLACAECHHRIAGLYATALDAPEQAILAYREAIALYAAYEPFVHGEQAALALCIRALELLEAP